MSLDRQFGRESKPVRRRSRPTTKADETTEFVAFWSLWRPHANLNDGRGSARDEFFRHVEEYGVDPQDIVDGAAWFIRSGGNQQRGHDGRPIQQHAQTWLNKRQYEDGCESERAYQARQQEQAERAANVTQLRPAGQTAFQRAWEAQNAREV